MSKFVKREKKAEAVSFEEGMQATWRNHAILLESTEGNPDQVTQLTQMCYEMFEKTLVAGLGFGLINSSLNGRDTAPLVEQIDKLLDDWNKALTNGTKSKLNGIMKELNMPAPFVNNPNEGVVKEILKEMNDA